MGPGEPRARVLGEGSSLLLAVAAALALGLYAAHLLTATNFVCTAMVVGHAYYAASYAGAALFASAGILIAARGWAAKSGNPAYGGANAYLFPVLAFECFVVAAGIFSTISPNSGCPVWPFL